MSAVFTASKVRGRKYIAVFVGRGGGGDKNGAHKHLCSSVGGYGINPPPKGGRICTAWEGEEKEKRIFSQILLEAPQVEHFNSQEEKPLINRNNISNKNNFIFFSPPPPSPPASIWHLSGALRVTPVLTSHQPGTVNGAVDTDLLLSGQGGSRRGRGLYWAASRWLED